MKKQTCMMKLAIVSETYSPEVNGVALTVASLVDNLSHLGHEVLLIRPRQAGESTETSTPQQCLVRGAPIPGYSNLRFGLPSPGLIRKVLNNHRPDAMYVATEGPLGWAAVQAANALAIPVATGFHTRFDIYSEHYGLGFAMPLVSSWLRRFHSRAATTLVPTLELAKELGQLGVTDTTLLERGVDSQRFSPGYRCHAVRESWGVAEGQSVWLHVGRLAAEKNLEQLFKAWQFVCQSVDKPPRLVIAGDGPIRTTLQAKYPKALFLGQQTGLELARTYASADAFLFPSRSETFGNVVLEALASGLPVVAFDLAAAGTYVRDGVTGFLAHPNHGRSFLQASLRLLGADHRLDREYARLSVARLRPIDVARRFADILDRLCLEKTQAA